jgi:hypothetical protein
MKNVGDSLPSHGIELKWVRGQPLMTKVLSMVSTLFPLVTTRLKEKCVGRIASGFEKDGMAVTYLHQLLDCMSSCEG